MAGSVGCGIRVWKESHTGDNEKAVEEPPSTLRLKTCGKPHMITDESVIPYERLLTNREG